MTFWPENIYCGESQPRRPIWVGIFKRPETPTSSWKVMGLSVPGHVHIHKDGQTRTILPVLQVASRPVRKSYGYERKALCPSYHALGNQGATYTPRFKHLLNTKGWGHGCIYTALGPEQVCSWPAHDASRGWGSLSVCPHLWRSALTDTRALYSHSPCVLHQHQKVPLCP